MTTKQDAELVFSHLSGPLRGKANGPAVNALHRLEDSRAELVDAAQELCRWLRDDYKPACGLSPFDFLQTTRLRAALAKTTTETTTTNPEN